MYHKIICVALAAISVCDTGPVRADDLDKPMFSLSGFGSAGLVHSSENQADFTSSYLKPNGVGYSHRWSADVDSRIAAQVAANLTPQLSAVVQVISEQRYDATYRPIVEWANVKYQVTPDLSVRIGRIALPTFLAADYRKLGYALPWARTPTEVYNLEPITSSDGVDLTYRLRIGDWKNTFQGALGKADINYLDGHATARAIRGFSNTTEYDAASMRLSYVQGDLSADFAQPLFDGFRQFGAQGNAIADRYDIKNTRMSFISLAASYDPGDWFVTAEAIRSATHSFLGDKSAWYVSGGYRIKKFTPYLILAQVRADSDTSDPGLSATRLLPQLAAVSAGLNTGINRLLASFGGEQKSVAVGMRWDFMKDAAVKFQYDHIMPGSGYPGDLILVQPGFRAGGTVNLFSAVLDFVF